MISAEIGTCARDLAEDAGRVDRGLASKDAVARALVDEHALAERVEVHAHDLGDERTLHDAGRTLAHGAQPLVLLLERFEAQELEAQHEIVGGELDVFSFDAGPGRERLAHRGPGLQRRLHGPLDRVGEGCDAIADGGEVVLAMIRDHESCGHRGEHDEAQPQRGAAEKEGPGIRVVRAQCGL